MIIAVFTKIVWKGAYFAFYTNFYKIYTGSIFNFSGLNVPRKRSMQITLY